MRGLPRDGAAHGLLPTDVLWASIVGGEAAQGRTSGGLRATEETEHVRLVPRVYPLRLQLVVARGMVLHQEPGGGAVPPFHRQEAGEAEKLVVGLCPPGEAQGGGHRGGAMEARKEWP